MNRLLIFTISLLFLTACSSSSKIIKPEFKPEFSIDILSKKGIAAIYPDYKKNYFKVFPYLFYNEQNTFNEIQGDFYNVTYKINDNLNILTGYQRRYRKYKNVLIVLIALSDSSKLPLNKLPISVESSKHGSFTKSKLGYSAYNQKQQRVLFIKKLALKNKYDILNKIYDDVITVTIGGQVYTFLNPELELNQK